MVGRQQSVASSWDLAPPASHPCRCTTSAPAWSTARWALALFGLGSPPARPAACTLRRGHSGHSGYQCMPNHPDESVLGPAAAPAVIGPRQNHLQPSRSPKKFIPRVVRRPPSASLAWRETLARRDQAERARGKMASTDCTVLALRSLPRVALIVLAAVPATARYTAIPRQRSPATTKPSRGALCAMPHSARHLPC